MTDYAATPVQPFVQGIIQCASPAAGPVSFQGRGVSAIGRGTAAQGDFLLTLDQAVPGSGGVVDAAALPAGGVLPSVIGDPRTLLTVRGGSGAPPITTITQQAVSYGNIVAGVFVAAAPGASFSVVRVVLSIAGVGTDPVDAAGGGCEVVCWKAAS